jgi:hypothetical protein
MESLMGELYSSNWRNYSRSILGIECPGKVVSGNVGLRWDKVIWCWIAWI